MSERFDKKMHQRVVNILGIESLNVPALDMDGCETEAMHLLGNDHDARFVRLKTFLHTICRNKTEQKIVDLLSEGYSAEEIAEELHHHFEYTKRTIRRIRNRCLKHLK